MAKTKSYHLQEKIIDYILEEAKKNRRTQSATISIIVEQHQQQKTKYSQEVLDDK